MKMLSRGVPSLFLIAVLVSFLRAEAGSRIQIKLDTSEAEQVLAIVAGHNAGKTITDSEWNALFAAEPYQRLKKREAAMQRSFTDEDFKKFVLSPELAAHYQPLRHTLEQWKHADMKTAAERSLAYLPASAVIRTKVFPEIKPKHNSFVFDVDTDPAIFLYLDPTVSKDEFENTVAHEMHHIGLSSSDKQYEQKIAALPPAANRVAKWMGAFGEGEAVLAAAGGPGAPPNQYSKPDVQQNWVRGMQSFNQDLETLNTFFLDVVNGKLSGDAADEKAYTFFGDIQGPWYTVGYRMAVMVEERYGRPALIACMLDRRLLLARYNAAAQELNQAGKAKLPLWSPELLKAVESRAQ